MYRGLWDLLVLIAVGVIVASYAWHLSLWRSVLERWAEDNGFEILERKNRFFFRGPFSWTTARGQMVYRVRVRDSHGNERTGWVKCGGWFWGLMSDNPEVWWDNEL